MQTDVFMRQIECFPGYVGKIDAAGGEAQCAGDADAAAAAAQIEHGAGFAGQKGFKTVSDQFRYGRPRNERAGVADEFVSGEPGFAEQIGGGDVLADARPDEFFELLDFILFKFTVLLCDRLPEIEIQCAENQEYGLVLDVIGAMSAMDAGARQAVGELFNI